MSYTFFLLCVKTLIHFCSNKSILPCPHTFWQPYEVLLPKQIKKGKSAHKEGDRSGIYYISEWVLAPPNESLTKTWGSECAVRKRLKITHPIFQNNKTEIKRGEVFYSRSTIYLLVVHNSEFSLSVTDGMVHFKKHFFVILKFVDYESLKCWADRMGKWKMYNNRGRGIWESMRGKRREYYILHPEKRRRKRRCRKAEKNLPSWHDCFKFHGQTYWKQNIFAIWE